MLGEKEGGRWFLGGGGGLKIVVCNAALYRNCLLLDGGLIIHVISFMNSPITNNNFVDNLEHTKSLL